ncbi:peptidase M23B [Caballeronia temeraria]|uniref:Peptidase M23B n=1 Tax=Caballeronia temeraria TaxID=1777137 RepID=A0A157ZWN0_9BURK|nr:peptidoglycan DD-metalloendopeptidase family protein [Caballeronia temeraria]SAK49915.1 peptidase M23B [Caballeronia temeraria]
MNTPHRPSGASGARALVLSACLSSYLLAACVSAKPAPDPNADARVVAGYYRVNEGDTLAGIASAFGRDTASLKRWNGLEQPDKLAPGKVLRVAPPPDDGKPPQIPPQRAAANSAACGPGKLAWPVSGAVQRAFGGRNAPDIRIDGTPGDIVKASKNGRVVYTGNRIKGYGLVIIVRHDEHLLTAYGFTQRVLAKEGDNVKRGQTIAEMGKAPLLFEVRKDGKPVDPAPYLKGCES